MSGVKGARAVRIGIRSEKLGRVPKKLITLEDLSHTWTRKCGPTLQQHVKTIFPEAALTQRPR